MASHPALSNYDIVCAIFEQVEIRSPREHRIMLAQCARVCKTFCDPALAVLWRVLLDLMPLSYLLEPTFQRINLGDPEFQDGESLTTRYVSPEQFSRFQHYARYVQIVCGSGYTADPSVLRSLSEMNNSHPLLPALKEITWLRGTPVSIPELLLIIPRSLRGLHVDLGKLSSSAKDQERLLSAVRELLNGLVTDAPLVEELTIYCGGPELLYLGPELLHIGPISELRHLRRLNLFGTIMDSEFLHFLSVHGFRVLAIHPPAIMLPSGFTATKTLNGFRTLNSLSLVGDLQQLTQLFTIISPPLLSNLTICIVGLAEVTDSAQFLSILGQKLAPSLHCISLQMIHFAVNTEAQSSVVEICRPLFGLRNLISFEFIVLQTRIPFPDYELPDIAKAWPNATKIALNFLHGPVLPSVHSLVHFARHCLQLKVLELPRLNLNTLPGREEYPVLSHGLTRLRIGHNKCDVPRPKDLAEFLDCLFPELSIPACRANGIGADWELVFDSLATYQFARKYEMVRVG